VPVLPRTLPDFISSVEEYFEYLPAPALFKQWGGVFIVSAALSRRCWTITGPTFPPLFPNLFAFFTGQPGCGKDIVINNVVKLLLLALDGMTVGDGWRIAGRAVTAKGLIDELAGEEAEFSFTYKEAGKSKTVKFSSILVCVPELGTFMPSYNPQLIGIINELYNCSDEFEERVRGRGNASIVKIVNPHIAMLLGTQPATLCDTFPEQSFRSGFFSRINLIHTDQVYPVKLFDRTRELKPNDKILSDIRAISSMRGQFKTSREFEEAMNDFNFNNPGKITHSRFSDYNTRRALHLQKLSMICSASESNSMHIALDHFNRAKQILLTTEAMAPQVFSDIFTSDGFSHTVEQVLTSTSGTTITHAELERKLRRTHRPSEVGHIIRSMKEGGDITEVPSTSRIPVYKISDDAKEKLH
jgi:hypothetical protein